MEKRSGGNEFHSYNNDLRRKVKAKFLIKELYQPRAELQPESGRDASALRQIDRKRRMLFYLADSPK
ncbi:MAG TPA: hypothetical protein VF692_09820 [Pyrinomonadaceae bacterium]